jgi:precorrin-6Y C5,15-methyltransferase (decarboxylating)
MKNVTIVGTGLGEATVTPEAQRAIDRAEVITGAASVVERFREPGKRVFTLYQTAAVAELIQKEDAYEFAVLVSGDTGFYSAAAGLADALSDYNVRVIPGISSINAFFARLKLPWQDAAFASAHGRGVDIAGYVRRNRLTFCLTGNNVQELGEKLCEAGLEHIQTYVGENLGAESEKVYELTASKLAEGTYPSLTVLLFVNDSYDDSTPCGLPDHKFTRMAGIPMTKCEVRALAISKLRLKPGYICWDVGAGTGSVTVEMALNAYRGHVYAVEVKEEAIPLIKQNCAAFHLGNVTAVHGAAPEILAELPQPDAVLIGGSNGRLVEIISAILTKNPSAGIVLTAVTLETVSAALEAFKAAGIQPEITQISAGRGKKLGSLHMIEAQNPVTIFSTTEREPTWNI